MLTGRTVSHYQVLDKLGEGGMGVVYQARDTRLGRLVALKFLPAERVAGEDRKRRFVHEARAASALNHPNIVTVYEIDACEGADFIAMEYVAGRTLSQVIGEKPLAAKEALGYAVQIADALAAAHKAGIVHRDLKPGNLMVTEDGRVKVLDFGLAKLTEVAPAGVESTLTLVAGTPAYMAPEQAEGRAADARTDIYSFGAVLYEMLAGRRVFAGLARDAPPPIAGIAPSLQQIVARCLRRDPAERYQSAAALKAALEKAAREPEAAPSIAVLPFVNMSADKENEYFSDGLAEEIINALTKVPGLRVPARTSSFAFRGREMDVGEIGAKLKVGHVLEGSVRKAGDRIRVTAQLVNVADGYHLWSERYDRRMADVFDIQDEIAQAIVNKLRVQLVGEKSLVGRRTANMEAYNLYLRGRHWWNQFSGEGFRKAALCFEQAIAEDPEYAPAQAGLAVSYTYLAIHDWERPRKVMPAAKTAALRAVDLDEALAEAHWAVAMVRQWYEWDVRAAEIEYQRAVSLNPRDALIRVFYATLLIHMRQTDEALSEGLRALEAEPISVEVNRIMVYIYCLARRYAEGIALGSRILELHPHCGSAYFHLACAYVYSRRYDEGIRMLETARKVVGGDPLYDAVLAMAWARSGRRAQAREIVDGLEHREYGAVFLAIVNGEIGNMDRAFMLMERAYEDRDSIMISLEVEPCFDSLRSDPRFPDLVRRMGIEG